MIRTADWRGAEIGLVQGDITRFAADAIVNAANSRLAGGGGVDGAIHAAAGPSVMEELRARYGDVGCPTGSAVITSAGRLPARWIVHAVGPVWRGGTEREAELLASAYRSSLDLAASVEARSIAFAAISCGVYGYPLRDAASIALGSVVTWLDGHPDAGIERVCWVLRGDAVLAAFESALDDMVGPRPGS
jgi:O-acetyl-ADP-ribose deacetylase (regulator of RNase III)